MNENLNTSLPSLSYADLLDSGISLSEFARVCDVKNIRYWKTRGIPSQFQKTLFSFLEKNDCINSENKTIKKLCDTGLSHAQQGIQRFEFEKNGKNRQNKPQLNCVIQGLSHAQQGIQRFDSEKIGVSHLDSMRNSQPFSNDAACSQSNQDQKVELIFSMPNQQTGEILPFVELKNGQFEIYISPIEARLQRWVLQSAIKHLLPKKRISTCLRIRGSGQEDIKVLRNVSRKTAHFGGLQTCGSVWDCPICAIKISERRRVDEVLPAMEAWQAEGGQCWLLTLTHPHSKMDVLSDLLKGEQKAMSRMTGSRFYEDLLESVGCIGTIRAWEVTYGDNGFHPHFHIILFVRTGLEEFKEQFYLAWSNSCRLAKLPIPDRKAFDLQDGSRAHAYASKGVWGLSNEITKGHLKKSKKGRSPMDLIRSYAFDDDKQAGALFVEYSHAFFRKQQLRWSPGLKAYFAIGEKTDEEIAAEQDDQASVLGRIDWPTWKLVLKRELRGEIIEFARLGYWDAIVRLLDSLKKIEKVN